MLRRAIIIGASLIGCTVACAENGSVIDAVKLGSFYGLIRTMGSDGLQLFEVTAIEARPANRFVGQMFWPQRRLKTRVYGLATKDALFFSETEIIDKGNAAKPQEVALCSFDMKLVDGKLQGKAANCIQGTVEIQFPAPTESVRALPQTN
jgi:hypothetical protein